MPRSALPMTRSSPWCEPGHDGVEEEEGVVAVGYHAAEFVEGFGEGEEGTVTPILAMVQR